MSIGAASEAGTTVTLGRSGQELYRILLNSGQLIAGRSIAGVLQFVTLALIARHLGTVGFGHWGYALAFVTFFSAAADLGLSTLVMRDLSLRRANEPGYLGTAICIKLAIGVLAAGFALVTDRIVNDDPHARVLIWLLAAQMLLSSGSEFVYAMLRVRDRITSEVMIRTGQGCVLLLAVLALTVSGASAPAIAGAYVLASLAGCFVAVQVARRLFSLTIGLDRTLARRLLGEVWPLGIGVLMTSVYYYFDAVYMGSLGQTEAVGWYTAAYMFVLWIVVLVSGMRNAFLPTQSQILMTEARTLGLIGAYGRVSLCAAIVVPVGGAVYARQLLSLFYGSEFEPGTFALQVLMVMSGFMFLSSFFGSNLIVLGRQRLYLLGVTAGAVTNVCLNLVLIPRYSLDGAAVATLLSEAIVFLCMAFMCSREVPQLRLLDVVWLPLKAAAILAATFLLGAQVLPLTVAGSLSVAAFLIAALKLGLLAGGAPSDAAAANSLPVERAA
jgi:O-antigen/teichoic acid export membrane protein